MNLKVYHLKNCDTCKKAIKSLTQAGHELELMDVRSDGISREILQNAVAVIGFAKLLNTKSTTWRGLDDNEKTEITANKAIDLIAKYPTLMKRPLIVHGSRFSAGWTTDIASHFAST